MNVTCMSCGRKALRYARFKCPSCGDAEIIRCEHCRKTTVSYVCPKCGFEGP